MGQLCSVADIELYLLQNFNSNPSIIDDLERVEYFINAISAKIEKYCDRVFNSTDYIEVYDSEGINKLFLNQYPVNSISSIYYGSPFGTRTKLDTDIYTEKDGVILFNFKNIESDRFYEVTYNAGYINIPSDLNLIAVKMVVNELEKTTIKSNIKEEKTGDISYKYSSKIEIDKNFEVDLSAYKRVGF